MRACNQLGNSALEFESIYSWIKCVVFLANLVHGSTYNRHFLYVFEEPVQQKFKSEK